MILKPITFRDDKYLAWVRERDCVICGTPYCDPNHINKAGTKSGGMGLKTSDYRTVPFCRKHHTEYHTMGRTTFENNYNIDLREELINTMEFYIYELRHGHIEMANCEK